MVEKVDIKDREQDMCATMNMAFATSDFYQLLSLSLRFPSQEVVTALLDGSYKQDAVNILEELSCSKEDIFQVDVVFNKITELTMDDAQLLSEMRKEYTRLFNHPRYPSINIYESTFVESQSGKSNGVSHFLNSTSLDVERCYQEAGVSLVNKTTEPADYIVTELEFMMYLYRTMGMVLQTQDNVELEKVKLQIRQFKTLHIGRWGHEFFNRLENQSRILPFRAIAELAITGLGKVLTESKGPEYSH